MWENIWAERLGRRSLLSFVALITMSKWLLNAVLIAMAATMTIEAPLRWRLLVSLLYQWVYLSFCLIVYLHLFIVTCDFIIWIDTYQGFLVWTFGFPFVCIYPNVPTYLVIFSPELFLSVMGFNLFISG